MTGLVVHKSGMTRVFTEDGLSHGVTVLYIPTQRVAQLKTPEKEGYAALQVAVGVAKRSKINKPMAGHYQKAGVEPGLALHEFRVNSPEMLSSYQLGDEIKLDWLKKGDYLDISGFTKGCGYAGTVKRHNFRTQDASHGNSVSHRVPGSIGQNQTPGRVFKGKKMSGHMGNELKTIQSLEIISVDFENRLVLLKGAVPGKPGQSLILKPAVKKILSKSQGGK